MGFNISVKQIDPVERSNQAEDFCNLSCKQRAERKRRGDHLQVGKGVRHQSKSAAHRAAYLDGAVTEQKEAEKRARKRAKEVQHREVAALASEVK